MWLPILGTIALYALISNTDDARKPKPQPVPEVQIINETCIITLKEIRTKTWKGWKVEYGAPDTVCTRTPTF